MVIAFAIAAACALGAGPAAAAAPDEPPLFAVYRDGAIQPLAVLEGKYLFEFIPSHADLEARVRSYLRPGRRYELMSRTGKIGTATITGTVDLAWFDDVGCKDPLAVPVRVELADGASVSGLTIAVSRPWRTPAARSERPIDDAERRAVETAARGFAGGWANSREKFAATASGTAIDLDGDRRPELVATVRFDSREIAPGAPDGFGAYVLLVMRKDARTTYDYACCLN